MGTYDLSSSAGQLDAMSAAIAHRGPDADGTWKSSENARQVQLGHRRLSIIDLSAAANQPFVKDGLALVFGGEIYNYRELRAELQSTGSSFRTNSDTEVLLEAWRRWGPASLSRLRGMFAFAIFDEHDGTLTLARDQFGIKPLFWMAQDGGIAFASELKGLRPLLGDRPTIDQTAIVASLMYYWIPEDHCVYQGVHKLPAGCWLQVGPDGHRRQERFFDPRAELAAPSARSVDVKELRGVLEDSVAAHLVADVPVSTFLSGGLDSSLLTVLAARKNPEIDSYTISFRPEDRRLEAMPDDLAYARKLAARHGIRLHEVEIAPDVADLLPRMVYALDEPIGDAAAINAYLICRAAREAGVKVLLSGMGADELFAGYRKHYAALLAARYRRLPGVLRHRVVAPVVDRLPVAGRRRGYRAARWAKRFVSFADLPEEAAFRRSYTHYDVGELQQLLDPELWPAVDQLVTEHAAVYNEGPAADQVNRMCYTDTRLFLPGLNLAYTDRASMAASTEVRVPYVDKEVAAAAFAIPGNAKIVGRERKAILKQAAEAWLPREIVYRPKGLFSAPLRAWIRRDLADMVEDLVAGGTLVTSGLVDKQMVRTMIDDDRRGAADRSKEI
ncbi:MAG TPA: asparagine synthase (glutamine-hydrolyzing), partial [Propionibacteriaceae bacterium]|nr:asparagine synthase (glutamine-hydrolyzing) [Propionibacteriaceae bacterium]